jgi:hypothetical protein
MDIGSALLILAVIVLVGLFISQPFFEKGTPQNHKIEKNVSDQDHSHSALLAERDRILGALEELDFDHALGKIPTEEYPHQRTRLLNAGANVLRQLDSYNGQAPVETAEARLEAVIAHRRADIGQNSPQVVQSLVSDDELEELISARRQTQEEQPSGFCPQCGRTVQKSDRFCPKCGTRL